MQKLIKYTTFIALIAALIACKGLAQPESEETENENLVIGKTIEQLGTNVSRIFQDSQNNYWFASNGVVKYDGETLTQFTTKDGLYQNRVRDIQEDHLGNIYFDTGKGINKFDGNKIEKLEVIDDSAKARMLEPNDLWFAGDFNMNGAYRWDGEQLYHLKMPKHSEEVEFRRNNPTVSYHLYSNYSTLKDKDGYIWFGGSTFGACRFDGNDFLWVSEREMTELNGGSSMGVRTILQDLDGNFYFGSDLTSKYKIVTHEGVETYEKLPGFTYSKEVDSPTSTMSIVQDDEGNFWMSIYQGGVWKYDGEKYTHYPILLNNKEVELFSIYKDHQGVLWLGTHNAGTYKFNGKDFVKFER